jgi:hypothetical protein
MPNSPLQFPLISADEAISQWATSCAVHDVGRVAGLEHQQLPRARLLHHRRQPGDTLARLAAGEAIIGLLIEITFIATFTQRFFAR